LDETGWIFFGSNQSMPTPGVGRCLSNEPDAAYFTFMIKILKCEKQGCIFERRYYQACKYVISNNFKVEL
jgi:hypothetical protein